MGKQYGVRCDDDFQAQIEEAAKARGWSVPDLFREATRQYIKGDEYVEITPNNMRMRKIILDETERKRQGR